MRCSARRSGLPRGGYADFVQWTRQRYLTYTQLAIAQHVPVQIAVADIAAQIDAAELLARRCAGDRAGRLRRHDHGDAHPAAARLYLCHADAAQRDGRR